MEDEASSGSRRVVLADWLTIIIYKGNGMVGYYSLYNTTFKTLIMISYLKDIF